jgi:PAS domain S-box-containing protein
MVEYCADCNAGLLREGGNRDALVTLCNEQAPSGIQEPLARLRRALRPDTVRLVVAPGTPRMLTNCRSSFRVRDSLSTILRRALAKRPLYFCVATTQGGANETSPVNALTGERNGNTSEERYEAILRKGRDGIVVINKAGIIQSFNPAAQKMFGYEPAEVLGRNASMLMPMNCTGRAWYLLEGEVMACRKDRTLFPVEWLIAQWSDNGDDYFTGIIRDLTERKAAEERRREEEAKYRAIIDTAVDGIAVIDEHGIIRSFNGAAERLFGYRAEEVIGKNIRLLMPEPYRNEHDEYITTYKRTGIAKVIGIGREVSGCRKDNTIFPLEIAIAEWCSEGHRFFAGTMRDISHRKKAEERAVQAERMQALGQLAGGVAHDFNNVLQAIFSAVDQTKALPANADTAQQAVRTIARAAERGASVTERLLAFARRSELKAEVFDMTKVLNDVVGLLSQTLGAAITYRVEIETPLPPVFADKGGNGFDKSCRQCPRCNAEWWNSHALCVQNADQTTPT